MLLFVFFKKDQNEISQLSIFSVLSALTSFKFLIVIVFPATDILPPESDVVWYSLSPIILEEPLIATFTIPDGIVIIE